MGFHLLAWLIVAALGAFWSLLCWLGHSVLTWSGWSQGLDWATQMPKLDLPDWLIGLLGLDWVEWLQALLADWGPELQRWVAGLPDLSGWIGLVTWVVWGLGMGLLVLLGLLASGLIAVARRASQSSAKPT